MTSQILWSAPARSAETVVQRTRPVSLKAVVNSLSPAAELWSTWQNPAASISNRVAFPSLGNAVAAILPWWRKLRTAIERTQTPSALAVRLFSRGQRLIVNFCRRLKVPGNLSLRALVHDANQAARSIFHAFQFPPVRLPSLLIAHESNVTKGSCHGRQVTCKG